MARWSFEEGMLFGAAGQWWNDKRRRTPHEGLDFRDYFYHHCKNVPNAISKGSVRAGDEVYPLLPGEVVAVFKDFMASTVVVAHRAVVAATASACDAVGDGAGSSGSLATALEHGPRWLRCRGWPPRDRQLLTVFAHIEPAAGVAPGLALDAPHGAQGARPLGTIANGRSAAAAASASSAATAATPCHLHLSVAVGRAAGDAEPPTSWGDLIARFEFVDPPIPAGRIAVDSLW